MAPRNATVDTALWPLAPEERVPMDLGHAFTSMAWRAGFGQQQHYDDTVFNTNFPVTKTSLIVDSPDASLGEISETSRQLSELLGWGGLPHSPFTLSLVLRAVGYTHKRISTHFLQRCAHRRREFARKVRRVLIKCIVSMDEVHKDGSTVIVGTGGRCAVCQMRS